MQPEVTLISYIAHLRQQCHNSKSDFSGKTYKGFEVLLSAMSGYAKFETWLFSCAAVL